MIKKILSLACVALLALGLVGCGAMAEKLQDTLAGLDSTSLSDEDLYFALDAVISNPESSYYDDLPHTFTVTAVVWEDPFTMEVENDNGEYVEGTYITASISRNLDDYFFVELGDLEYNRAPLDIITLTATPDGSVYWTEEGDREEIALFKAKEIVAFDGEAAEPNSTDTAVVETKNFTGEFTFKAAQQATNSFGDIAVLYFDFKNTSDQDITPQLSSFAFYQGDIRLEHSIFSVNEELDPSALEYSISNDTFAGKTQYYYVALAPNLAEGEVYDPTFPLEIIRYDDHFNIAYYYEIPMVVEQAA